MLNSAIAFRLCEARLLHYIAVTVLQITIRVRPFKTKRESQRRKCSMRSGMERLWVHVTEPCERMGQRKSGGLVGLVWAWGQRGRARGHCQRYDAVTSFCHLAPSLLYALELIVGYVMTF